VDPVDVWSVRGKIREKTSQLASISLQFKENVSRERNKVFESLKESLNESNEN
jgi:hypothetical protein